MLPKEEWLHLAKRLAIGQKQRVFHRREKRPNMVVANDHDKYWCYCQRCKEGAVLLKEHVKFNEGASPEATHSDLTLPNDMVPVLGDEALERAVGAFLASKCMDFWYLKPGDLFYSKSRKRLIVRTASGSYFGRDITGAAMQKWLTYNNEDYVGVKKTGTFRAYVVEDLFSYYKVVKCLSDEHVSVYCSLGTGMTRSLMLELLQYQSVTFFYDGDSAGYDGSAKNCTRLQVFGPKTKAACAPAGKDPKDMTISEIRDHYSRNL